jgi:hypothetical protein
MRTSGGCHFPEACCVSRSCLGEFQLNASRVDGVEQCTSPYNIELVTACGAEYPPASTRTTQYLDVSPKLAYKKRRVTLD